ncbi:deoxycytidylate deaminase-like isoform X2 [Olea europaea var. sylvestris]|uniref:deoxycytidylate deaminase-like isoform X2 n=1 Tax=Olea europaea var. sylvestris TaxID=158386 RepID=UPI000C1D84A5|nr:deoxycytidylate deaminase-like isoform X2 [Olea europaea var. sylvestris]
MINSREIVLVSTATIFGAAASAIAFHRFFYSNRLNKRFSANGVVDGRKPSPRNPFDPTKRKGYLSWDDYFMAIAFLSAERSKDPNRQVGACLVSQKGIILGIGYNGFPRGCSDDKLPWSKKSKNDDPLETKYPYVCHAEVNAILNTNHASAAGQSGVSEVIYYVEKRLDNSETTYAASHKLLSMAGVKVRRHQPQMDQILINFNEY